jgi:adenylyltransferase/sulfurtransferase
MTQTPNVYGSVSRFEGQAAVFAAPGGPCYRCLHPEPPPAGLIQNCAEAGVLGVLPGIIGTIQATEAIKLLAGIGRPLVGALLLYDALSMRFRQITLARDPGCPVCGDAPTIRELETCDVACEPAAAPGASTRLTNAEPAEPAEPVEPVEPAEPVDMTVEQLHQWRTEGHPHLLIDVREPSEHAAVSIEGAELIPLRSLPSRASSLPKDRPIVVHCQTGGRSAIAVAMLVVLGFTAHNLSGGIKAWRSRIEKV